MTSYQHLSPLDSGLSPLSDLAAAVQHQFLCVICLPTCSVTEGFRDEFNIIYLKYIKLTRCTVRVSLSSKRPIDQYEKLTFIFIYFKLVEFSFCLFVLFFKGFFLLVFVLFLISWEEGSEKVKASLNALNLRCPVFGP